MSIGSRLKEERERLGLTIPELAEIAGAKKNTVIDWQKDLSSPPAAKLAALGEAGVDLLYVLIGTRSIGRPGMTKEEVEQFNELVDLFWSTSEESRKTALNMLSALHLRDVQDGSARGVRKKKPDRPASEAS